MRLRRGSIFYNLIGFKKFGFVLYIIKKYRWFFRGELYVLNYSFLKNDYFVGNFFGLLKKLR